MWVSSLRRGPGGAWGGVGIVVRLTDKSGKPPFPPSPRLTGICTACSHAGRLCSQSVPSSS
jgi:hypothetical protein